ncbi:MAG: NAD(+)/NADH kinase [Candidatus Cloacimonetes bacterium]|nr:NAD(+)/NADH kinase [Candidatus Cloacimonadota bacterium]MBS3767425.1 NAD(+)/NADH kinase [Candidatus Cloacimonadota bacterium]
MSNKFKNIGIFYNPKHFASLQPVCEKIRLLSAKNFKIFMLKEQEDNIFENVNYLDEFVDEKIDLIIAFGGDGTMLKVLKQVLTENTPVLGFNHGKVGFLSECEKDEFNKVIKKLLHNEFSIEKRSVMECKVKNNKYFAINDIEVGRGMYPHIITVDVFLNDSLLYRTNGDGIILSTPTGSTAYSLSAGGSVLHPQCNALIITPNNPHNQFSKPVVVSDNTNISLRFMNGEHSSLLNIDGINICKLNPRAELSIRKSDFCSKFVKIKGKNFCQIIRNKFNFGED